MKSAASQRISRVVLPDPVWRYLILFQSWSQLFSWAGVMGASLSLVALVIWLLGDPRLIPETIACGLLGGTWSLLFATKAQFSIRGPATSEKAEIERILTDCLYIEQKPVGQEKRFGQKLPALLRWGDSDVTIVVRSGALVCTGPQLVIRRLRSMLVRSC
ncbi:hypothetical protein [Massilia sp. YMA4]|uniref:PH domain-containing protein n=1 Tax=[Empedobacter] haloabium TaxID=592317 RepID=A0ABZ1UQX9_9BURK|nr:hypothetical protein [Massilia sp. YMA4]